MRSHVLVAAKMGPYAKSESAYARELWDSVPDDSVSVVDRLFLAAGTLIPLGLQKFGVDPAVSSTVFLTTVTDVVGFLAFLGLATIFLV